MKSIIFDIHDTIAYQEKKQEYFIHVLYDLFISKLIPKIKLSDFKDTWIYLDMEYQNMTRKGYEALLRNENELADYYLKEESYLRKFEKIYEALKIPGKETDAQTLNNCFQKEWISGLKLYPYTIRALEKICKKNKCGIVTNFRDGKWIRLWIQQNNLEKCFGKNIVISDEIGFRKPHPKLFTDIISIMEIDDINDSYFIGDNIIEDKIGAQMVGIKTLTVGQNISSVEYLPNYLDSIS